MQACYTKDTLYPQMHFHMLCDLQLNIRVERYSRCTKVFSGPEASVQ
jgi:hypothetical protein